MMNKNWIKTTLGECAIINDRTYLPREQWPFVNYLETGQITNNRISGIHHFDARKDKIPSRARRKVQLGDIVYSTVIANKNNFGIIKKVPDNFLVSTAFAVIRGMPYIADTSYIYYFITQKNIRTYFSILAEQSSSVIPALQIRDLKELQILLPPIEQQQSIAHILETFDNKIHLNQQISGALEEIVRTLFQSWFVDFDPVRAKMDGSWQPYQSLPGLPAHLYDLFPNHLKPSELGKIPCGWQNITLSKIIETVRGCSYRSVDLKDSNNALVTLKSFNRGGGYRRDGLKSYTGSYKTQQIVKPGELVIAMTDVTQNAQVVGQPAIVQTDQRFDTLIASLDALIIRPTHPNLSIPYLYGLARTHLFREHTLARATGTTVLHLSRDAVPTFPTTLPPNALLKKYNQIAFPIFKRIDILTQESQNLERLRDALVPKLLSGEIRVEDLEGVL